MSALALTNDQQDAERDFVQFLLDPDAFAMILSGYAGTGKSTLVRHLLDTLPATLQAAKLITEDNDTPWEIVLTATTNKAANALSNITSREVKTIQSLLKLRPQYSPNGKSKLIASQPTLLVENTILFIDEASYVDLALLKYIKHMTKNCKIIFIGDPAQLTPIGAANAPVFSANIPESRLTNVVRQAEGNPIIELATMFRDVVNGEDWKQFKADGHHIQYIEDRAEFDRKILEEFNRSDWKHADSKVLAWTNKTVVKYNQVVRESSLGEPELQEGDYAVCNSYINVNRKSIKTDELVQIVEKVPAIQHDVPGHMILLDSGISVFMAESFELTKARRKQAKKDDDYKLDEYISNNWIDLRAAYACTVNKSQGSTYQKVYIDLNDIAKCNSGNQIARMLYVAVTRASDQVFLTGGFT